MALRGIGSVGTGALAQPADITSRGEPRRPRDDTSAHEALTCRMCPWLATKRALWDSRLTVITGLRQQRVESQLPQFATRKIAPTGPEVRVVWHRNGRLGDRDR